MRLVVTGLNGQVVRALMEAVLPKPEVTVYPLGRPWLDLSKPETILPAVQSLSPDLIVNAAGYTAVDLAEAEPEDALSVNAKGAGAVARAAFELDLPLIHLSTDYVFDGKKESPYTEEDPVAPLNVYGASKLAGEDAVAVETDNHVILRTAWLYSPYGKNFVRTMAALVGEKEEVWVVDDQIGTPTYAPELAKAIIGVARALLAAPAERNLRGLFHFAGSGETSWAGFAAEIFRLLAAEGKKIPSVIPISTADYPTAALRPLNSRLNSEKSTRTFGLAAPPWQDSLARCITRLKPGVPIPLDGLG